MDIDLVGLAFRWLHILPAIAAVGGAMFMRFALLPSMPTLPDETRRGFHEAIRSRWAKVVMASIGLLLISGLYNIAIIESQKKIPEDEQGMYRALFGIKFLLALVIFFISSAMVGRSQAFDKIRQNARFWLTLNVVLAVVLVCISGALRLTRDIGNPQGKSDATVQLKPPHHRSQGQRAGQLSVVPRRGRSHG